MKYKFHNFFQIVPTEENVLTDHKKETKNRKRRNLKSARRAKKLKSKKHRKGRGRGRGKKSSRSKNVKLRSVTPLLVKKQADSPVKKREERRVKNLEKREEVNKFGTTVELEELAKYELIIDRPFMYALICDNAFLQLGRYSSATSSDNQDISNRNKNKKFVAF